MGGGVFVIPFMQRLATLDLSSRRISVQIRGAVSETRGHIRVRRPCASGPHAAAHDFCPRAYSSGSAEGRKERAQEARELGAAVAPAELGAAAGVRAARAAPARVRRSAP
jgi:hypothetical protein